MPCLLVHPIHKGGRCIQSTPLLLLLPCAEGEIKGEDMLALLGTVVYAPRIALALLTHATTALLALLPSSCSHVLLLLPVLSHVILQGS
jgi:hypothetical protein